MAVYYVDSKRGNDSFSGITPDQPWKSLEKANAVVLEAGDRIRLTCGGEWSGSLKPQGAGSVERPCVIEPYGAGPRPAIHGEGAVDATIHLFNTGGWIVRGLEITNNGPGEGDRRMGILAELDDYGTAKGLTIEDNYVHDVNGCPVKAHGDRSGGIFWRAGGNTTPSRFVGVRIRRNRVERCDRVGIYCRGMGDRRRWFPMLDVVIQENVLEDIGGDGILNIGTDGCIVERNRLINGRMRDNMYCAGIWPWSADNTIIRYNEASGYRGTKDGQGFDCDDNCIGTTHMYNYSHDNEGGYILVCTVPEGDVVPNAPDNIGCAGSLIRRNLTVNDLCRTFHIAGPVVGTRVEENCVYAGEGIDIPAFLYTGQNEKLGPPKTTVVARNVLAARGTLRYVEAVDRLEDGTFTYKSCPNPPYVQYTGNHFLGNHVDPPKDDGTSADPPSLEDIEAIVLDEDGHARPGLETLDAFIELMDWPRYTPTR